MRKITYRQFPAVGSVDVLEPVTKSLADFVEDIPYFLSFNLIPPMSVLNEEFGSGEHEAGMSGGCIWEPFIITGSEYSQLVETLSNRGRRHVEVPAWVRNRADWHIYKMEFEVGIPSEEHYRLSREEDSWTRLREEAIKDGDQERVMEYHLKAIEAGQRLAKFMDPFLREYQNRKARHC